MRVSTEWYGIPCGLKYPFAESWILLYIVRKRCAYSPPVTAAAAESAGDAVLTAAMAGLSPITATRADAPMVATATQDERRRVSLDIGNPFLCRQVTAPTVCGPAIAHAGPGRTGTRC